ncbi:MAG: DUF4116 domain-containing protein [Bacteroides sp.]|nr:DUF4116 domain-containing protein [Bacteroides sp.]
MNKEQYRREKIDLRMIKNSDKPLDKYKSLPLERRTVQVSLAAIERDVNCFVEVPDKTPEMAKLAVEKEGSMLKHVPAELITKELCYEALCQSAKNMEYVPEELRSKALCKVALHYCEDNQEEKILKYIPYPDVCYNAVRQYNELEGDSGFKMNHLIRDLKEEAFSENLVRYIAQSDNSGGIGKEAPEKYRPLLMDLILDKVAKVTYNLWHLPYSLADEATYKELMRRNPHLFQYIADRCKTKEVCKVVLDLTFYKDQDIYFNYPSLMPFEDLQLECLKRLENDENIPLFLVSLGILNVTKEIAEEALSRNSCSLAYIPKTVLAQDMVDEVLKRDPSAIKWTPVEYLNSRNTILAFSQQGRQTTSPKLGL